VSTDDANSVDEQGVDIWQLPQIVNVSVERARFDPPRLHISQGKESRVENATAIVVETDREFPVRSAAPVLFVGAVGLTEAERIGANRYRFLALGREELRNGAPIGLGWTGVSEPIVKTEFRFEA
jgi:hypothetical protein